MVPDVIIAIVTSACNLKCGYCYVRRFGACSWDVNNGMKVIDEAADIGVAHINFTGGEPLMLWDSLTKPLMKRAVSKGIGVSVVTNGHFMTESIAKELKLLGAYVYISLDTVDPLKFSKLRRGGDLSRVLRALEILRSVGVEFTVVFTVSTLNYTDFPKVAEVAAKYGAVSVAAIPVMPSRGVDRSLVPSPEHVKRVVSDGLRLRKEGVIDVEFWCMPFIQVFTGVPFIYWCRTNSVIDIGPDGSVLLCDIIDVKLGNAFREGLKSVIDRYVTSEIAKEITSPSKLPQPCATCRYAKTCMGGCYARAYLEYGNFNGGDPLCPIVASFRRAERPASGKGF